MPDDDEGIRIPRPDSTSDAGAPRRAPAIAGTKHLGLTALACVPFGATWPGCSAQFLHRPASRPQPATSCSEPRPATRRRRAERPKRAPARDLVFQASSSKGRRRVGRRRHASAHDLLVRAAGARGASRAARQLAAQACDLVQLASGPRGRRRTARRPPASTRTPSAAKGLRRVLGGRQRPPRRTHTGAGAPGLPAEPATGRSQPGS